MPSYRDVQVDGEAILEDIRRIAEVESPTSHPAGVNRVLDIIAGWFEGTGASYERFKIDGRFGDILRVRSRSKDSNAGILVLSHVDRLRPFQE